MRRTKYFFFFLIITFLCPLSRALGETYQSQIPEPIVRYKMTARLDPSAKTVKGHYTLGWRNHTGDTIPDLYFHLYLNAFKNVDSTFMREGVLSRRRELFKTGTLHLRRTNGAGWMSIASGSWMGRT